MIKNLEGDKEIVSFGSNPTIIVYDNTDNEEYPVHWHSPVEIILPVEGNYTLECAEESYSIKPQDIIIIPPGVLHHLYAAPGRRFIFQLDMKNLGDFDDLEAFFSLMQPAVVISPDEYPSIHQYCHGLLMESVKEYSTNAPLHNLSIISKVFQMFVVISRVYTTAPHRFSAIKLGKQQEYTEKFMSICDYVNKHCTEDISLNEISEKAGFSKYHFSRLFKEFSGVTFYKYLNIRRIAVAEKLLLNPDISITEVSIKSGFNSISSFMRMFKIMKNCTPTQYRDLNDNPGLSSDL